MNNAIFMGTFKASYNYAKSLFFLESSWMRDEWKLDTIWKLNRTEELNMDDLRYLGSATVCLTELRQGGRSRDDLMSD